MKSVTAHGGIAALTGAPGSSIFHYVVAAIVATPILAFIADHTSAGFHDLVGNTLLIGLPVVGIWYFRRVDREDKRKAAEADVRRELATVDEVSRAAYYAMPATAEEIEAVVAHAPDHVRPHALHQMRIFTAMGRAFTKGSLAAFANTIEQWAEDARAPRHEWQPDLVDELMEKYAEKPNGN